MTDLVESRKQELLALCPRFRVCKLSLFGTATRDDFQAGTSDLDFAVEFASMSPDEHATCYFGLLRELKSLFRREVDLLETSAIRNPYIRRTIENAQVSLYAA
jgi:uncharacterized protein